jgi:hypothetical protein
MEVVILIICVITAWVVSTAIDSLTYLGQLMVPPLWLVMVFALAIATWLMRD